MRMNHLFRRTPKAAAAAAAADDDDDDYDDVDDDDDDEVIADHFVLVEAIIAKEETTEEDDETVMIHVEDIADEHSLEWNNIPTVFDYSNTTLNDIVTLSTAVAAAAAGDVCTGTEHTDENDDQHVLGYEEDTEQVLDNVRTQFKAGIIIVLLISLLLFDAGDLYQLQHGRTLKPIVTGTTTTTTTERLSRPKFVPVAAPIEGYRDNDDIPTEIHLTPCTTTASTGNVDITNRPTTHHDVTTAVSVSDTYEDTTMLMTSPMIPTVRRSNSLILSTQGSVVSDTPRVSIPSPNVGLSLFRGDHYHHGQPGVSPLLIPMRSLIPYTTPRRVVDNVKIIPIPSVRVINDNYIPTNYNWTAVLHNVKGIPPLPVRTPQFRNDDHVDTIVDDAGTDQQRWMSSTTVAFVTKQQRNEWMSPLQRSIKTKPNDIM